MKKRKTGDPAHDVLGYERLPLDAIFRPGTVAVVGASDRPGSVGRTIMWNLISNPFGGTVYPVNERRQNVLGIKAYPSVSEVPERVDLAVIAAPAPAVPEIVRECVESGVGGAIIISAGFKETGPEGAQLEGQVLEEARQGHMRIIGPNCLGVMNPLTGLNATFASGMARPGRRFPTRGALMAGAVLLSGGPTLLIDVYNAQDISNRIMGPGFPWTRVVSPDEQEAFRWIRDKTPEDATVQQDPLSRHPTSWWVVPTFGQRRMAAGLPPFMLDVPEYHERSARVRTLFATHDPREAHAIARSLRIDFVYVDHVERHAYPGGVSKFDDHRYFEPAFRNPAVAVYRVR